MGIIIKIGVILFQSIITYLMHLLEPLENVALNMGGNMVRVKSAPLLVNMKKGELIMPQLTQLASYAMMILLLINLIVSIILVIPLFCSLRQGWYRSLG